jgi:ribosomal protein S18 acetylase RimI-like enzyme
MQDEMKSGKVTIRGAAPGDAGLFYELELMSSPYVEVLFGNSARKIFENMFRARRNLFSHEHTIIAESDGRPAGMLLGYGRKTKAREELITAVLFVANMPMEFMLKLPMLLRGTANIGLIGRGEFFISNVAVFPGFRGKGVARQLLAEAERMAMNEGATCLTLEVEPDNERAIVFYDRLGFRIIEESYIDLGKRKYFYRMAKPL